MKLSVLDTSCRRWQLPGASNIVSDEVDADIEVTHRGLTAGDGYAF